FREIPSVSAIFRIDCFPCSSKMAFTFPPSSNQLHLRLSQESEVFSLGGGSIHFRRLWVSLSPPITPVVSSRHFSTFLPSRIPQFVGVRMRRSIVSWSTVSDLNAHSRVIPQAL